MTQSRESAKTKSAAKEIADKPSAAKKKAARTNAIKPPLLKKPGDTMAQNDKQPITPSEKTAASTAVAVRLVENAPVTQPMLVNYTTAIVTSGLVMVDLGFLEPAMMAALTRTAKAGGKLPKGVVGKLGARVVLTPEATRQLHQQLARLLAPKQVKDKTIN